MAEDPLPYLLEISKSANVVKGQLKPIFFTKQTPNLGYNPSTEP